MDTEIRNAVASAAERAEYDQEAKRLLGQKIILAHILVNAVEEFKGMDPKNVVQYIEGEPFIGTVPLEPGLTNMEQTEAGERIVGFNSENTEINEGLVRFDIVFYVRMKDGLTQIIVNVEAQRKEPNQYHILNRAVFYACRLISSQKERDFVNMMYDDIKRVYSIFICMNMKGNYMNHVHLTNDSLLGDHEWGGKLDLLNVVLIGLSKDLPEKDEKYELHRLLTALLSKRLKISEKLSIIEQEYDIPLESALGKGVFDKMCNLSEGIVEDTKAEIIVNMSKKGYTVEQIADVMEKSVEEIEEIIKEEAFVLS